MEPDELMSKPRKEIYSSPSFQGKGRHFFKKNYQI
jgi:hypothetical protein